MNQYYLIAQLPSLDQVGETTPLPITEERFFDLCRGALGKKSMHILEDLTLAPDRVRHVSGNRLVDAWNDGERQLRFALGQARASKLHKDFETETNTLSTQILQAAGTAVEMENPLDAERFLNRWRMDFLETLRPTDYFSEDAVFYYGLKLKLILRMRRFDEDRGNKAYRDIYDSIMHGDEQEVE